MQRILSPFFSVFFLCVFGIFSTVFSPMVQSAAAYPEVSGKGYEELSKETKVSQNRANAKRKDDAIESSVRRKSARKKTIAKKERDASVDSQLISRKARQEAAKSKRKSLAAAKKAKQEEQGEIKDTPQDSKNLPQKENVEKNTDAEFPKAKKSLPPLRSLVTSPFGERRFGGRTGIRIHSGLDIRAHIGWAVVAYRSGTVLRAGAYGNAGLMVEIEHEGNLITRYAHLRRIHVAPGQHVVQGEKVGEVGCTGYTTGAHLHFAVVSKNGSVDPLRYLTVAEEIVRPRDAQIPDVLGPQSCNGHINPYTPASANIYAKKGPVIRGRHGRPIRIDLRALRNYKPPEIPLWQSRKKRHN